MSNDNMMVSVEGRVVIKDETNNVVLLDEKNAIHPQNMSRIIARALANEPNSIISRIAFGNGGTFKDIGDNIVFNKPNDGEISGWESRLYNETYSEVIDEENANLGIDLGSSGPNTIRPGGGSDPSSDPLGSGVVSQEAGIKSNVIITVFLNENEPSGQDLTIISPSGREEFIFDEIGLYSPGRGAVDSPGYASINVGDKLSSDVSNLSTSTSYQLTITVDGTEYITTLSTPAGGTGAGGAITYGDICDGINSGNWITAGDDITPYVFVFITDDSGGGYTSIIGAESYGYLTFQSKTTGSGSTVEVGCDDLDPSDFSNVLTNGVCAFCNAVQIEGGDAGVANDPVTPENERERLLTHLIFSPIPKAQDVALSVEYTLTVSGCNTSDSVVEVV